MGVEGCTKCIKYLLFFFNFIFWLTGGVILGVALWLRHDPKISTLLGLEYDGNHAPSTFYISVHILIAVGAVMMVVGFLGCYGAIQESQCLLGTLLPLLDVRGTAAVVLVWPCRRFPGLYCVVFVFQLSCCGKGTGTNVLTQFTDKFGLTNICPSNTFTNCHDRINELFHDKIYLIGIAALVVAVIMIFEMIFSMVLCCGIRNSPVY
ncbi:CD81 antigen-like [Neolamprologus brichardi]|uniref:CD81 antigen-like n=1 Tax=Neolamprologus brichardi TaxID=32507 RepID=UPI0003EBD60D|nr:CD81 antigen-like [Neolamprologus brichardi]